MHDLSPSVLEWRDVGDGISSMAAAPNEQLMAPNEALDRFAALEPQQAEQVKLRYLVGVAIEEAAEVLGVWRATADRW